MRIPTSLALGAAVLLSAACARTAAPAPPPGERVRWSEVAPGVWAALQPDARRFDDANAIVILGDEEALVVDAPTDPAFVAELIAGIRQLTDRPVRRVVNTHWHTDHTQGNALLRDAFGPEVDFVGHVTLVEDVPNRAARDVAERVERLERGIPAAEAQLALGRDEKGEPLGDEERAKQTAAIARARSWLEANRGAVFLAPTAPYTEVETVLPCAGREIHLLHARGHTRGDTVVYLPQDGLLLTGDLVDALPYVGHGYPREWLLSLEALGELDVRAIVPGHGPVFQGPGQIERVRAYLEDLVRQTDAAIAAGKSLEETRAAVDLSRWRAELGGGDAVAERFFDGVVGDAVERAYREGRGEIGE